MKELTVCFLIKRSSDSLRLRNYEEKEKLYSVPSVKIRSQLRVGIQREINFTLVYIDHIEFR